MILHVQTDGAAETAKVVLEEPDDFTAFSIRAGDGEPAQIAAAFGPKARADAEGHVWVPLDRLHALGEEYGGGDWRVGCDGMIAYATSKGWVDEAGECVRAHVER